MKRYDAIYLSPHLDDVALSCGGQIVQRTQQNGERVLIVTITAGNAPTTLSPFAQAQHASMQLGDNPVAERRMEDIAACTILGADYVHLDILDCIYRTHPDIFDAENNAESALYQSDEAIFGAVHPVENGLLTAALAQLPPHDELFAPLGIGNHVDHQLVYNAVQTMPNVRYYPDYPYTQRTNWQPDDSMAVTTIRLSLFDLSLKIAAISAYHSQVPHLFGGYMQMAEMVVKSMRTRNGELIIDR